MEEGPGARWVCLEEGEGAKEHFATFQGQARPDRRSKRDFQFDLKRVLNVK